MIHRHAHPPSTPWTTTRQPVSRPRRTTITTQSLLDLFRRGGNAGAGGTTGKVRPRDCLSMGPLTVSPMGLGTWSWGNQFLWGYDESMDDELQQVFNLATDAGINFWDTADSYGTGRLNGRSEQLLGQFLEAYRGPVSKEQVVFATKLAAYPWRLTTGQFVGACKASLQRTGVPSLGLVQLHWSTANYQPLQERVLWDSLVAIHQEGLATAVGVSNYGPQQLRKIHAYLTDRKVPLAAVQVQYSLLSCGPQQEELRAVCEELGLVMIAYSPLALGMLTDKYGMSQSTQQKQQLPKGPRGAIFKQVLPGATTLLCTLRDIADARSKSISQVALNWCMRKGTMPIPGAKSLEQVKDNLGALGWELTQEEVARLDAAAQGTPRGMVQNIFQTK